MPTDRESAIGFVYLIECLSNGRRYIGQKTLSRKIKRKPLKGKTRPRRSVAESKWRDYFGSSALLVEELEKSGREQFRRTVLYLCNSKWALNWIEMRYQVANEVLFRKDFWNSMIHLRANQPPPTYVPPPLDYDFRVVKD